jgi:hypothetical protein
MATALETVKFAEGKLLAAKTYFPGSNEITRLEFIVEDLKSKLTSEELTQHTTKVVKTDADIESERVATVKAMNENRDKPSI